MENLTTLKFELEGPLLRLSLNRPDRLNALGIPVLKELLAVCEHLEHEPGLRVVSLQGMGRGFSGGFDIQSMASLFSEDPDESSLRAIAELGYDVVSAWARLPQITVAGVHGFAIGGGILLMAACDFRVVEADCSFRFPEIDLGAPVLWGGVPLMAEALGASLAKDLMMTGRPFGTEVLSQCGFVQRVVEPGELEKGLEGLLRTLLSKPATPLRLKKGQFLTMESESATYRELESQRFLDALRDPEFLPTVMRYWAQVKGDS